MLTVNVVRLQVPKRYRGSCTDGITLVFLSVERRVVAVVQPVVGGCLVEAPVLISHKAWKTTCAALTLARVERCRLPVLSGV